VQVDIAVLTHEFLTVAAVTHHFLNRVLAFAARLDILELALMTLVAFAAEVERAVIAHDSLLEQTESRAAGSARHGLQTEEELLRRIFIEDPLL